MKIVLKLSLNPLQKSSTHCQIQLLKPNKSEHCVIKITNPSQKVRHVLTTLRVTLKNRLQ